MAAEMTPLGSLVARAGLPIALALLGGPRALAQGAPLAATPSARPAAIALALPAAIARAIANDPDLGPARIDVAIARAQVDLAWSEFEPFAFGSGRYARTRSPVFLPETSPGSGIALDGLP
ncbi:MAG TPA: hypothetical protein VHF22_03485, partial [Planctomycetota bacterium]|nr:hypothetical protein [Planctomycetota bacterium]